MAFKKKLDSEANIIIAGGDHAKLFPIGFRYRVGDELYTVTKKFCDGNTHFRRVVGSDGSVEDMTVDSIIRDFREQPCKIETEVIEDPNQDDKESGS